MSPDAPLAPPAPAPERALQLGVAVLVLAACLLQVGEPEVYQLVVAALAGILSVGALSLARLAPPPAPLAAAALWCLFGAFHSTLLAPGAYLARAGLARRGLHSAVLVAALAATSSPAGLRVWRGAVVTAAALSGLSAVEHRLDGTRARPHWMGIPEPGAGPAVTRVAGIHANPNLLGGFLAVSLPVSAGLALAGGPAAVLGAAALAALSGAGLGLAYSRSSWLVALVGVLVLVALAGPRRRLLAIPLGAALVAVLVAAPGAAARALSTADPGNFGIAQRLALLRGVTSMMLAAPLAGFGLGSFHTTYPMFRVLGGQYPFDAHGQILQEAVETGAPGLGLGLLLAASSLAAIRRRRRPEGEGRPDVLAALAGAAVLCLFASPLQHLPLAVLCLSLLGAAAAPPEEPDPGPAPEARREGPPPERGRVTRWILQAAAVLSVVLMARLARGAPERQVARLGLRGLAGLAPGEASRAVARELAPDILGALGAAERWDPGAPEHAFLEARLLEAMGHYVEAEASYRRTLARNPHEGLAWQGIARARQGRGDLVGALEAMDEALRLDPLAEAALTQKARLLVAAGEMEAAELALRAALSTNEAFLAVNRDTYPQAMRELIQLLEGLGRLDEAQGWRERYLDLYGETP